MMTQGPQSHEEARCRQVWASATLQERMSLCYLESDAPVLYLSRLRERLTQEQKLDEDLWRETRLDGAEWKLTAPRHLRFSQEFCARDDAMEFMIASASDSMEGWMEILRRSAQGADAPPVHDSSLSAPRRFSRELYTVMMACIIVHVMKHDERIRASLSNLLGALKRPTEISVRSWPSKRAMGELQEAWAAMSADERVDASSLSSAVYWFVQACDMVVSSSLRYWCERRGLGDGHEVVTTARERTEILSRVDVHPGFELVMSPELASRPDCLSLLHRLSLKQAVEKEALLQLTTSDAYKSAVMNNDTYVSKCEPRSWDDIERVLATFFLAGLLQRVSQLKLRREESLREVARAQEAKSEASKRKRKERLAEQKTRLQMAREEELKRERLERAWGEWTVGLLARERLRSVARTRARRSAWLHLLARLPKEPVLSWKVKNTFVEVVDVFDDRRILYGEW